jgi:hypothetical protein
VVVCVCAAACRSKEHRGGGVAAVLPLISPHALRLACCFLLGLKCLRDGGGELQRRLIISESLEMDDETSCAIALATAVSCGGLRS